MKLAPDLDSTFSIAILLFILHLPTVRPGRSKMFSFIDILISHNTMMQFSILFQLKCLPPYSIFLFHSIHFTDLECIPLQSCRVIKAQYDQIDRIMILY